MKKILYFLILVFSIQTYAQGYMESEHKSDDKGFIDKAVFSAGYYGNMIWNPGLNLGTEYLIKDFKSTKDKKWGTKTITHQLLLNGNLGYYWDPKSHSGLVSNYGISWKRTNHKGRQIGIDLNLLGYVRTFLPETYLVENGEVKKLFLPGRSYYAPSFSIGTGKLRHGKKLTSRYFKLNTVLIMPYNNAYYLPMIFVAYGYRFNL